MIKTMKKLYRSIDNDFELDDKKVQGKSIKFNEYSVDLGGFREIILSDALTQETINKSDVFCTFNHDDNKILARCKNNDPNSSLKLSLTDSGLFYTFEIPNTELGRTLLEQIKRGEIYGSSFAFTIADDSWEHRTVDGVDTLVHIVKRIDQLFDVSPVYTPAYDSTHDISLRSFPDNDYNVVKIEKTLNNLNGLLEKLYF
jgi:uncharacterized protein